MRLFDKASYNRRNLKGRLKKIILKIIYVTKIQIIKTRGRSIIRYICTYRKLSRK